MRTKSPPATPPTSTSRRNSASAASSWSRSSRGSRRQTPSRELEADPAVAVAEPDGYRTLDSVPDDPLFSQLWGLRNTGRGVHGFAGAVAGDDVGAVAAWNRTIGRPTTVVADIDSGYRFDDPDLGPVAWTNPGEIAGNGIDDDANGYVDDVHGYDFVGTSATTPSEDADPTDDNIISGGHGLHTAGTIGAAGDNGVGITGVARNARIMPLRVCSNQPSTNETRCPFSSILAAINYAGEHGRPGREPLARRHHLHPDRSQRDRRQPGDAST